MSSLNTCPKIGVHYSKDKFLELIQWLPGTPHEHWGIGGGIVPHQNGSSIQIPQFSAHETTILQGQPGIINGLSVSDVWLAKNVRSHSGAANLRVVMGFGDSMAGMFNSGDPVLVDTGITSFEGDAVYFFRVGEEGFIKRLQRIPGEGLRVLTENKKYDAWTVRQDMDFQVFGRVIKAWCGADF